jgi:hypothetical protein
MQERASTAKGRESNEQRATGLVFQVIPARQAFFLNSATAALKQVMLLTMAATKNCMQLTSL